MNRSTIPETTVRRLPVYLRCLEEAQAAGVAMVSSSRLAEMAGSNAAQVRKDLSHLGGLGTRGLGYDVPSLARKLEHALGLVARRRAALVGYGRLGSALVGYGGFAERGFEIVAVLDADPAKAGMDAGGVPVRAVSELEDAVRSRGVEIVIITTPAAAAQPVADAAVRAGVKALLNMAPVWLVVPDDVAVRNADLAVELQVLSFHLGAGTRSEPQECDSK